MAEERVLRAIESGPKPIETDEAEWFVQQAGLEMSRTGRRMFELGIHLAQSTARQAWVGSKEYADATDKHNGAVQYATSEPKRAPQKPGKVTSSPEITDKFSAIAIRQWAVKHGYEVAPRGRIAINVREAFIAAYKAQEEQKQERAAKRAAKAAAPSTPAKARTTLAERRAARRAAAPKTETVAVRASVTPAPTRSTKRRGRSAGVLQPGEVEF
jgi:hypothetical protein